MSESDKKDGGAAPSLVLNIRLTGEWAALDEDGLAGVDQLVRELREYVGCDLSRPQVFMMGLALLERGLARHKKRNASGHLFEDQIGKDDLDELGKKAKYQAGK